MKRLLPDFLTGIMLAWRAKLISTLVWITIALFATVILASQFSGRQPATVGLDVGISVIRLALPLLIVFLTQELFTREFDRRYFLSSLSYPRSRTYFLLGRFTSVLFISLVSLLVLGVLLGVLIAILANTGYKQATPPALDHHYLLTLMFIGVDLLVLTAMATLLAIVAVTPSFVLIGTLGFMLIARSYSGIIALLESERYLVNNPESYQHSLGILSYLLPDLGRLDVRGVTLYGKMEFLPGDWPMLISTDMIYVAALLALSLWLLQRKRFN